MRIDFHLHYLRKKGFVEDTLKLMDEAEVDKALLVPFSNYVYVGIGGEVVGTNEEVSQVVKTHPARFVGCIYVDPREQKVVEIIDRYYEQGFKCIKMHPTVGYYPNDPRWDPIFEHINELGLPVLIHTGWTRGYCFDKGEKRYLDSSFAQPVYIDYPARKYSHINFIIAHMGEPWFLQTWRLAEFNPNVCLDLTLRKVEMEVLVNLCNSLNLFTNLFAAIGYSRIIWGSDNMKPPKQSIQDAIELLRKMGIPDECHNAIFGGTAQKILRIAD